MTINEGNERSASLDTVLMTPSPTVGHVNRILSTVPRRSPRLLTFNPTSATSDSTIHRSTPRQTASIQPLYTMIVVCRLRDTVGKRLSGSINLGTHTISGDDWRTTHHLIWVVFAPRVEKKACFQGVPPVWSGIESDPTIDDFDHYISIRFRVRTLTPWTDQEAQRSMIRNRHETFTVSGCKWGKQIGTDEQLAAFNRACTYPHK